MRKKETKTAGIFPHSRELKKIKSYPFYNTDNPLLSETDQLDIFKGKTFLEFNEIKKNLLFSSNTCIPLLAQPSR